MGIFLDIRQRVIALALWVTGCTSAFVWRSKIVISTYKWAIDCTKSLGLVKALLGLFKVRKSINTHGASYRHLLLLNLPLVCGLPNEAALPNNCIIDISIYVLEGWFVEWLIPVGNKGRAEWATDNLLRSLVCGSVFILRLIWKCLTLQILIILFIKL